MQPPNPIAPNLIAPNLIAPSPIAQSPIAQSPTAQSQTAPGLVSHVRSEIDGPVLRLTIDRPEKKNALTDAMYADLTVGLRSAATDAGVRVVLITGAGGVFTSGNDIADFAAVAAGQVDHADRHVHAFLDAVARFPKPLVAAVPGLAVGIGTTLLLHCDIVLLAESARLSTPFVNLGVVPEAGSSLLLPARIGHQRAFAMFALGEAIDAATALAWGLANRVVADDRLDAEARGGRDCACRSPTWCPCRHQAADARRAGPDRHDRERGRKLQCVPAHARGASGLSRVRRTAQSLGDRPRAVKTPTVR